MNLLFRNCMVFVSAMKHNFHPKQLLSSEIKYVRKGKSLNVIEFLVCFNCARVKNKLQLKLQNMLIATQVTIIFNCVSSRKQIIIET